MQKSIKGMNKNRKRVIKKKYIKWLDKQFELLGVSLIETSQIVIK